MFYHPRSKMSEVGGHPEQAGGTLVRGNRVFGKRLPCTEGRMRRTTTAMVKKQATGRVSAEAAEDVSDTAKRFKGIQVFWIQEACKSIRVKRERTKVRWRILEGRRIGNSCLRKSLVLSLG
jgi:hypothetical protein